MLAAGLVTFLASGAVVMLSLRRTDATAGGRMLRRSVAVIDFRNLSGRPENSWLSVALADWLRSELGADERIRTLPGEQVGRVMTELSLQNADGFSPGTVAILRRNLSADLILTGSYLHQGDPAAGIRFDLRLQDAQTGEVLVSHTETGLERSLLSMVAHAGTVLRERLALGPLDVRRGEELLAVKPSSAEAAKFYAEGLLRTRSFDTLRARDAFEKVAILDPDFALGHSALAEAWYTLGFEGNALEASKKAVALSSRLPRGEAILIQARQEEFTRELQRAVRSYQTLWTWFPDNIEYGLRLAKAQANAGEGNKAYQTLEEIRKLPSPVRQDPRVDLTEAQAAATLGEYERSEAAAKRAAESAEKQGARLLAADAHLARAWALRILGRRSEARDLAEGVRQTYGELGDRGGVARALKNLADILHDQGDLVGARRAYDQGLQIFRAIGYETGAAVSLNNMAYVAKDQGDLAGARGMFAESLEISRKIRSKGHEARALNGLGIIAWRQGDLSEGNRLYGLALLAFREVGAKSEAAAVLNNFAIALKDRGHLGEAAEKYKESLDLARQINDQTAVARAYGNLGELALMQGDLVSAKSRFERQLEVGRQIGEDRQRGYALHGLADVLLVAGDLGEAEKTLSEAIRVRKRLGEDITAAESETLQAQILIEAGKLDDAIGAARDAAAEFHRQEEPDEEALAQGVLAQGLARKGDVSGARSVARMVHVRAAATADRGVRIQLALASAQTDALVGDYATARGKLLSIVKQTRASGYMRLNLEARYALEESALKAGTPALPSALSELEKEARSKGFDLVARKIGVLRHAAERRITSQGARPSSTPAR
jgi:tetratricopeptide (TPR) repeat protein/TolB-like protein